MSPSRTALQIWTNDVTVVIQSTDRAHTCATWHGTDEHAVTLTTAHATGTKPQDLTHTAMQWKQWWLPFTCSSGRGEMRVGEGVGVGGGWWGWGGGVGRVFVSSYESQTEADLQKPVLPLRALNTLRAPPRMLKIPILHFHNRVYFWSLFPHTPGESYHRWLRLFCSCDVCWALTPLFCYCHLFLCKRPQNQW